MPHQSRESDHGPALHTISISDRVTTPIAQTCVKNSRRGFARAATFLVGASLVLTPALAGCGKGDTSEDKATSVTSAPVEEETSEDTSTSQSPEEDENSAAASTEGLPRDIPVFDWRAYDENLAEKLYEFPIGKAASPVAVAEKKAPTRFDLNADLAKPLPQAFPVSSDLNTDREPYITADGKYALVGDSYEGGTILTGADGTVRQFPGQLGWCNPVEGSIMFCAYSGSDKGPAYYGLFDAAAGNWKVKIDKQIIGYDFVGSAGTAIISDAMGTVMYFVLDPHTLDPVCRTDMAGKVVASQTDYAQTKSLVITQPWRSRTDVYQFTILDARTCETIATHEHVFDSQVAIKGLPVRADTGWITWAEPETGPGQLIKIADADQDIEFFMTEAFVNCAPKQYPVARANRVSLDELWTFLTNDFTPGHNDRDACFLHVQVEAPYLAVETYDKVYLGDKSVDGSFVVAATKDASYAMVFTNLTDKARVVKVDDGSVLVDGIKASSLPAYLDGHFFLITDYGDTPVFTIGTE